MPSTEQELRERLRTLEINEMADSLRLEKLEALVASSERDAVADLKAELQRERDDKRSWGRYVITAVVTLFSGALLLLLGKIISQAIK